MSTLISFILLIKDKGNHCYTHEMDAAYFLINVVVSIAFHLLFIFVCPCPCSRQCCKAFGIGQYYVFIYLVDYWVLLGISWCSSFSPRFSSALLVCLLSVSHSNCSYIFSLVICSPFGKFNWYLFLF